jgi:hypothetical protein
LAFVTAATKSLKKEEELVEGAWKYELSTQVSSFLDLLHDSIRSVGPVPTELGTRLDGYRTRLKVEPKQVTDNRASISGSSINGGGGSASGTGTGGGMDHKGDTASIRSVATHHQSISLGSARLDSLEGPATDDVARVFGLDEEWMRSKLQDLLGVCTEQAALDDLKVNIP